MRSIKVIFFLFLISGAAVSAAGLKSKEFVSLVEAAHSNIGELISCSISRGDEYDGAASVLDYEVLRMAESYGNDMPLFEDAHYDKIGLAVKINSMTPRNDGWCKRALDFQRALVRQVRSATKNDRKLSRP